MERMNKTSRIGVRLDKETRRNLEREAARRERSLSWVACECIKRGLDLSRKRKK